MVGPATEAKIAEVVDACNRYGRTSIIALAGPPATGKSHIAIIAAQRHADEPTRVKEIQFHQSFALRNRSTATSIGFPVGTAEKLE